MGGYTCARRPDNGESLHVGLIAPVRQIADALSVFPLRHALVVAAFRPAPSGSPRQRRNTPLAWRVPLRRAPSSRPANHASGSGGSSRCGCRAQTRPAPCLNSSSSRTEKGCRLRATGIVRFHRGTNGNMQFVAGDANQSSDEQPSPKGESFGLRLIMTDLSVD